MRNTKFKQKKEKKGNKNLKQAKLLTEEFELPIALSELVTYVVPEGKPDSEVLVMIDKEEGKVNEAIKKILADMKEIRDWKVTVQSVELDYCDHDNIDRGVAYFKVMLQGTKQSLKKVGRTDWPFSEKEDEESEEEKK